MPIVFLQTGVRPAVLRPRSCGRLWPSCVPPTRGVWIGLVSIGLVPSYVVFALCLMAVSALASRIAGLRTASDAQMRIADADWRLMRWVHYVAAFMSCESSPRSCFAARRSGRRIFD